MGSTIVERVIVSGLKDYRLWAKYIVDDIRFLSSLFGISMSAKPFLGGLRHL